MELSKKDLKDIRKWVSALRSGKYQQTTGSLQDLYGYCCLGVACDVFIPEEDIVKDFEGKYMKGGVPNQQPKSPEWLKNISFDFKRTQNSKTAFELIDLNDTKEWNFNTIADAIEITYLTPRKSAFDRLVTKFLQ